MCGAYTMRLLMSSVPKSIGFCLMPSAHSNHSERDSQHTGDAPEKAVSGWLKRAMRLSESVRRQKGCFLTEVSAPPPAVAGLPRARGVLDALHHEEALVRRVPGGHRFDDHTPSEVRDE